MSVSVSPSESVTVSLNTTNPSASRFGEVKVGEATDVDDRVESDPEKDPDDLSHRYVDMVPSSDRS